ncbi:Arginine N-methyltransferase 2 [Lobaria immixta]|nr:Arginine N-methyltransferase 2 [Lobaria immixta]
METDSVQNHERELQTQHILLAASNHDLKSLGTLLRTGSANVQDSDTGFTPLHAAIAACEPLSSSPKSISNGIGANRDTPKENSDIKGSDGDEPEGNIAAAATTVKLLLQNGAIWNDVDANDETPGCLARRLGLNELYEIMVDAGVRAEMLLNRLDEYQILRGSEDDEDKEDEGREGAAGCPEDSDSIPSKSLDQGPDPGSSSHEPAISLSDSNAPLNNTAYLSSNLFIHPTKLLDASRNGIMMSWETPIMERTAAILAPSSGLRILNVGHGMGIIDTFFQKASPTAHHIIEAHPIILAQMRTNPAWSSPMVTIHAGKWQDVVPNIIAQGQLFDVIYFDTFAEDYSALRDFFSDFVIGLLDEGGKWGFFNGLGADRQICYDVYGKVVEMDLFEAGFDTEWTTVNVPEMKDDEEWEGVKRKYWALREYRLPICRFLV